MPSSLRALSAGPRSLRTWTPQSQTDHRLDDTMGVLKYFLGVKAAPGSNHQVQPTVDSMTQRPRAPQVFQLLLPMAADTE